MQCKRSNGGEALTTLILEVFQLNGLLLAAGNRITEPYGMTGAQWQIVGAIDLEGRPLSIAQIARRMGLARQGVQRIVKDLVRQGVVELQTNPDHKRAYLVAITKDGSNRMDGINRDQARWVNELSRNLTERSLEQTVRVLQAIREREGQLLNHEWKASRESRK